MSAAQHPPRVVYGRQAYIPEWQPELSQADLEKPVTQNGEPLGFTIGDMLPERQWVVNAKTGELISQRDFESLWERYVGRHVPTGVEKVVDIRSVNEYFDVKFAPVPTVQHFASRALDWQGKEVEIGFDPDKPPTAREEDVKVYNAQGEEASAAGPRPSDIVARLTILNDLRSRGRLTESEYVEEVAALTSGPVANAAVSEVPKGFTPADEIDAAELTARCGKVCGSKAGRAAHERHCESCNPTSEAA